MYKLAFFFFFWLCAAIQASNPGVQTTPSENPSLRKTGEQIMQQLKDAQLISPTAVMEKIIIPETVSASHILFINQPQSTPLVAKVFKTYDTYIKEKNALKIEKNISDLIRNAESKVNYQLPIITQYKGSMDLDGTGIILLERAKGKTLGTEMLDVIPSIPDAKIKEDFMVIGEIFGGLDRLLSDTNDILVHNDSHGDNLIYDDENKKLYWIDTAGLSWMRDAVNPNRYSSLEKLEFYKGALTSSGFLGYGGRLEKLFRPYQQYFRRSVVAELPKAEQEDASYLTLERPEGLRSLPEQKKLEFAQSYKELKTEVEKRLLALNSFNQGYCKIHPMGSFTLNRIIEKSNWEKYFDIFRRIDKAINVPTTIFPVPEKCK